MKHTPGPWEYRKGYDNIANADIRGEGIAGTIRDTDTGWNIARIWETGKRTEANAKLIAAAPELLEACREAQELIKKFSKDATGREFTSFAIEQAIAKATD
jgi:hypothetical protein